MRNPDVRDARRTADQRRRSARDRAGQRVRPDARRVRPRPVAAAEQLGPLGRGVQRRRLQRRSGRLARRPGDRRRGERAPRGVRPQERRRHRRPLARRSCASSTRSPRVDRPLVRRPAGADPRRPRAGRRVGRHRPGAVPRRAAAADLRAARRASAGARQPGEPPPRRAADVRPVPLRVRQRGRRGRGEGAVRDLRRARARASRSSRPRRRTSTRGPRPRSTRRTPSAGRC